MDAPRPNPPLIYKVAARPVVETAQALGNFPKMPIDEADGYIHFSTAAQLRETLRLHFAGQGDLTLLAVDPDSLGDGLRWEPSRGGQLFPHHYGTLGSGVVARSAPISVAADGSVTLPDWVQ
ncbi:MAG: DUF952 domain-containing protein [Devosia sp.]